MNSNNRLRNIWESQIKPFTFTHTTSDKIAEKILEEGLDPNKRHPIFDEAKTLNELLLKYAALGTSFVNPQDLNRDYVFISPDEAYVGYRLPESVDHLLCFSEDTNGIKSAINSDRTFRGYSDICRSMGISVIVGEEIYNQLDFSNLDEDYRKIRRLRDELRAFGKDSQSTTLYVHNEGVLDQLPNPLPRIFQSFDGFFETYAVDTEHTLADIERNVRLYIRGLIGNEIKITKKVGPEYITLSGDVAL